MERRTDAARRRRKFFYSGTSFLWLPWAGASRPRRRRRRLDGSHWRLFLVVIRTCVNNVRRIEFRIEQAIGALYSDKLSSIRVKLASTVPALEYYKTAYTCFFEHVYNENRRVSLLRTPDALAAIFSPRAHLSY